MRRIVLGVIASGYPYSVTPPGPGPSTLLAVGHDGSGGLLVYNTSTWTTVTIPAGISGGYKGCFSPDGSLFAIGTGSSPYLTVYETTGWTKISFTPGLSSIVRQVSFSPDGSKLAISHGSSPYIVVFRTSDWGKETIPYSGQFSGQGIQYAPSGAEVGVAPGYDPNLTAAFFNPSGWSSSLPAGLSNAGYCCAYTSDGTAFVVGLSVSPWIRSVTRFGSPPGVPTLASSARAIAYSPDGSKVAVALQNSPYLRVFRLSDMTDLGVSAPAGIGNSVAFSADSSLLAVAYSAGNYLTVFNTTTWNAITLPVYPSGAANGVIFNNMY